MTKHRLLLVAGALAGTLLLATQEYFTRGWSGGPLSFDSMLFAQLVGAAAWVLLVPSVILPLWRRFPLGTSLRGREAFVQGAAALAIPLLQLAMVGVVSGSYYYGWAPRAYYDILRDRVHTGYAWGIFVYALIVAALYARSVAKNAADAIPSPADDVPRPERYARRILVKDASRVGVIPVEQVDWLEANDNHVVVHTRSATHTIRTTLSEMAERLDPMTFVRVHRSTVVNVERVREVQPWFQGELVLILKDDTRLKIGRTYRDQLLRTLEG